MDFLVPTATIDNRVWVALSQQQQKAIELHPVLTRKSPLNCMQLYAVYE